MSYLVPAVAAVICGLFVGLGGAPLWAIWMTAAILVPLYRILWEVLSR